MLLDYDTANDNWIEIANLAQLNGVRWDLDANGAPTGDSGAYAAAFPRAMTNMGCAATCFGYELVADLDFDTDGSGTANAGDTYWNGGAGWVPIGRSVAGAHFPFYAEFSGNGHTISNLYINRNDVADLRIGLFGSIGHATASVFSALVRHVGLINPNVKSSLPSGQILSGDVGALVGWLQTGSVVASYVQGGAVQGGNYVGGLVGSNSGTVLASWSSARIPRFLDGVRAVAQTGGGLVGTNQGTINVSYSTGCVLVEPGNIGGLAGLNSGTVTNSYFNNQVCATPTKNDVAARGKTTVQLQNTTDYGGIYGGWNVNVDGVAGTDSPWDFGTTSEYPALKADRNSDGTSTWREFGLQGRADAPDVNITADQPSVTEGQPAQFTVSIDSPPGSNLSVNLQQVVKADCATVACGAGTTTTPSVTIMAGQTSAAHTVPTAGDEADEYARAITLTARPDGRGYDVGSAATVTVVDDEPPPAIEFNNAENRSSEGFEKIRVSVKMTPEVTYKGDATVDWATVDNEVIPGSSSPRATDGVDFPTSSGTVTFHTQMPGEDVRSFVTFDFALVIDDIDETDEETFLLEISNPQGADATIGTRSRTGMRILDDDMIQPQLAPTVAAAAGSDSLTVSWAVPPNTAANAFSGYNVQYRLAAGVVDDDTPAWADWPQNVQALSAVITGLDADTEYQARVAPRRVASPTVVWSAIGTGSTGALPPDTGTSAITGYDLRYRLAGSGVLFTNDPQGQTLLTAAITGLAQNRAYEVQARAVNTQGGGAWSTSGYATTTVDSAIYSGLMTVGVEQATNLRGYI